MICWVDEWERNEEKKEEKNVTNGYCIPVILLSINLLLLLNVCTYVWQCVLLYFLCFCFKSISRNSLQGCKVINHQNR